MGEDKGTAIRRWMSRAPMRGTRPVFLGDDITDEAAFAAVRDLDGAGILVGAPRPTAALYRLANPAIARAWLSAALR
jgi:trehalose 6-phosphate phosphatase